MKLDDLENIDPELIKQYVENAGTAGLTEEQEFYLYCLKTIQQLIHGQFNDHPGKKSKNFIVKYLTTQYPEISRYQAGNLYADAINFFYIDKHIKLEAWGNFFGEELYNLYLATIESATSTKDYEIAHKILLSSLEARTKYRPQESQFPEELFTRPNKIYTQDPRLLSQEKTNRRDLAQIIDTWDVPQADKARIRVDAGIDEPKLILPVSNEAAKGE